MTVAGAAATIGVVDYGMGNRRSVEKALEHVGARVVVTADHDLLRRADGLVVPGVGAFPRAMANLRELGLDRLVSERAGTGTPILGLCLGMQLLFEESVEFEAVRGLGLLRGRVEQLDAPGLKLPHIGWNRVTWRRASALSAGLPAACAFYHVHSFAVRPADESDVAGEGRYGSAFVSAVAHPPLYGVQFHPEKSSVSGLRLLGNFVEVCGRAASPGAVTSDRRRREAAMPAAQRGAP